MCWCWWLWLWLWLWLLCVQLKDKLRTQEQLEKLEQASHKLKAAMAEQTERADSLQKRLDEEKVATHAAAAATLA